MPTSPATSREDQVPLVVDLDGTLIKTDLLWESLARLLRRNPFTLFAVLLWWLRGRAFLKRQLARRVTIDPADLPYNEPFLAFLREQKKAGRKLVLATASDRDLAVPVANHIGLFDEVLGSDGKTNLRGANKLKVLEVKFGERGFDYAGNSTTDLAVWRGAREAIVTNASRSLVNRVARCAKLGPTSRQDYSPFATFNSFLNELLIRSGYLAAIGAGLLLTAAFPKIGIAGFAWAAPALLLACALGKRGGEAFRVGYVAGLAHFLSSLYWLLLIPVTGLPVLGWVALSAYLALYPAVWIWLVNRCGERTREPMAESWAQRLLWSLGGAAAWVALEMLRARLLGGFPWNLIGASQFQLIPLIQIASITGVYGVSFLVVWVSLSLFSAVRMTFRRPTTRFVWQGEIILPLATVAALFAFGFARMSAQNPPGTTLRITLVQPSIPQTLIWNSSENDRRFQQLLQLSQRALDSAGLTNDDPLSRPSTFAEASADKPDTLSPRGGERDGARGAKSDLLIWPESAVPDFNETNCVAITNLIRTSHVWLIFNADDVVWRPNATSRDDYDIFNAAFLFNPQGRCAAVYHKQKLVIFGEYIPLAKWLPFVKWLTPITGSFASGDRPVPFELKGWDERPREPFGDTNTISNGGSSGASPNRKVKTSTLICFEDIFPQLVREYVQDDTDFLVNLTNDGWFGDSAAQWQHMANAVFSAVETGVPLVCCANNGLTCWVDANGRLGDIFKDQSGSVYGVGALTIELPLQKRWPTFYHQQGDWFGWSCAAVSLALLGFKIARRATSR